MLVNSFTTTSPDGDDDERKVCTHCDKCWFVVCVGGVVSFCVMLMLEIWGKSRVVVVFVDVIGWVRGCCCC